MHARAHACRLAIALMVIIGGTAVVAPHAAAQQQAEDIADSEVTRAVERFLAADDAVPAHLVDVTTLDGVVTLSGTVPNLLAAERARTVALGVRGVRAVVNNLEVRTPNRGDRDIRRDVRDALAADMVTEMYDVDVKVDDQEVR